MATTTFPRENVIVANAVVAFLRQAMQETAPRTAPWSSDYRETFFPWDAIDGVALELRAYAGHHPKALGVESRWNWFDIQHKVLRETGLSYAGREPGLFVCIPKENWNEYPRVPDPV